MTFASELTRLKFHELLTDEQLYFARLEERLAKTGMQFHIDSVMKDDKSLELVCRITGPLDQFAPASTKS